MSRRPLLVLLSLFACLASRASAQDRTPGPGQFFFDWPSTTSVCQVVPLTWSNGTAPFTAWVIPVFGEPFFYNIPDSAYANGAGRYDIALQLDAAINYVMIMSDADGIGSGGSSEIQTIQPSNDSICLGTYLSNQTSLDFTFTVSGVANQCARGFETSWSGGKEDGPYNFTIIPLDQGFRPFDVALQQDVPYESDWVLNLTAGSRFTVMYNSAQQYGRGGIAKAYEVGSSNDSSCVEQTPQATGAWPSTITLDSIEAATLAVTQSSAPHKKGLAAGVIAGIVIGALACLVLLGLILWFLLRRKKRRQGNTKEHLADGSGEQIDLAEGQEEYGSQPMMEPYTYSPITNHQAPAGHDLDNSEHSGSVPASSTAGFAGLGAGTDSSTFGPGSSGESSRPSEPGTAGPLPPKTGVRLSQQTSRPRPEVATSNLKSDILSQTDSSPSEPRIPHTPNQIQNQHQNQNQSQNQGGLRVVNHDDPSSIPALPLSATSDPTHTRRVRPDTGPTFRRHEDAGRVEQVVDLPPLYTDVPRDGTPQPPS